MARVECPSNHLKNNSRFPHSIYKQTNMNKVGLVKIHDTKFKTNVRTHQTSEGTGSSRTTCKARPELHFENVSEEKEQRRHETNLRPKESQQTRKGEKIPYNITLQNSRLPSGWRLVNKDRYISGIPTHSCSRIASMLPSSHLRQGTFADDELALWPLICTSNLRDNNELDCGNPSFTRTEIDRLSGRFPFSIPKQGSINIPDWNGNQSVKNLGMANKCILEPRQELEFLGIIWNTQTIQMKLPKEKLNKIAQLSREILSKKSCTLKQLQSLLGQTNFANFVIYRGRLHCRHLQR